MYPSVSLYGSHTPSTRYSGNVRLVYIRHYPFMVPKTLDKRKPDDITFQVSDPTNLFSK